MTDDKKYILIRNIDPKIHQKFKVACAIQEVKMNDVLLKFLTDFGKMSEREED